MINLDELLEVIDENISLSGGVRYVAEYMTGKGYCSDKDRSCYNSNNSNCVECWMMKLTDEVENNKNKGKNK